LSDIRRSDIFRGYIDKNFNGCPINVYVRNFTSLVYSTRTIWYNDTKYPVNASEWEVELVKVFGKALNMETLIKNHAQVIEYDDLHVGKPCDRTHIEQQLPPI
jgi:hypothetical protein